MEEEKIHCRDEGEHKKRGGDRDIWSIQSEHGSMARLSQPCEEGGEERVKRSY